MITVGSFHAVSSLQAPIAINADVGSPARGASLMPSPSSQEAVFAGAP